MSPVWVTAGITIGICALTWLYVISFRPVASDRLILTVLLLAPAVALAYARSTLLVDYLLILVVINRLLRRLLDWGEGHYDPTPVLSLLPLAASAFMACAVALNWRRLPPVLRTAFVPLAVALGYGFAVGAVQYGLAACQPLSDFAMPFVVLYYAVMCRPTPALMRRWVLVLGTLGILVGAYGIYQWIVVPPWDGVWLVWSGMYTSMGAPKPYAMSICSSLESRGPASIFFATVTALFVAVPTLRRRGGLLLATIPAVALLLTLARTGWIYVLVTLVATAMFARRRGGGGIGIILTLLVVVGVGVGVLSRQEEAAAVFDRMGSLGDVQSDASANARTDIADAGFKSVLQNPLGFGFGSSGVATKLTNLDQESVTDNGYLEILTTLGVPGTLLYAAGLFLIVRLVFTGRQSDSGREPTTVLGMGLLLAMVPALVIGNCLVSAHASYVWILVSRHLAQGSRPAPAAD